LHRPQDRGALVASIGESGLRILILNWRDLDNPWAGGAEVHIHAIAEGLVARGHAVTLLVSGFPGSAALAERNGVRIRRAGNRWNANLVLCWEALRELRRHAYDIVIEDLNKVPFFTAPFHDLPMVVYVPHLFGATVFREANPLSAAYVWAMERPIPAAYRRARWIAISESTRRDLVARGVPRKRTSVVLCGLDFERYDRDVPPPRFDHPALVHLGRLMRYKSADVALHTLALVRRTRPDARLYVAGDGPDLPRLKRLARRLGIDAAVAFLGYLPHEQKVDLLWRCHLLLNPSPKEGWGLTVIEANACGVPVVASRRPGLQDSVQDGRTGLLVEYGDAAAFADACTSLLADPDRHARFAAAGRQWARSLSWEDAAVQTEAILERTIAEAGGR
jgi:glycosyltransferase involved in cell wall biosynthesis